MKSKGHRSNPDNDLDYRLYGGSLRVIGNDSMGRPILKCDKCGNEVKSTYPVMMGRGPKCQKCKPSPPPKSE